MYIYILIHLHSHTYKYILYTISLVLLIAHIRHTLNCYPCMINVNLTHQSSLTTNTGDLIYMDILNAPPSAHSIRQKKWTI